MPAIVNNLLLWAVWLIACMCWNSFDKLSVCLYVYSYFEKGCRKNVHSTIPKGNVGYDQYTAAVEPTFFAFLQHSQTYIHGLSWFHSFKLCSFCCRQLHVSSMTNSMRISRNDHEIHFKRFVNDFCKTCHFFTTQMNVYSETVSRRSETTKG